VLSTTPRRATWRALLPVLPTSRLQTAPVSDSPWTYGWFARTLFLDLDKTCRDGPCEMMSSTNRLDRRHSGLSLRQTPKTPTHREGGLARKQPPPPPGGHHPPSIRLEGTYSTYWLRGALQLHRLYTAYAGTPTTITPFARIRIAGHVAHGAPQDFSQALARNMRMG
jgi:hypothetical protein